MKLNGRTLKLTPALGWPVHIPETGVLELRFETVMAPPMGAEPMGDAEFANICREIRSPGATDQWRLGLLQVICGTHYFSAVQGDALCRSFTYSRERVVAAAALFGRILDPHKFDVFTASLDQ